MATETLTKANARIESLQIASSGGVVNVVTAHVTYDLLDANGVLVDARTVTKDVLASLTGAQKTALNAFWGKVTDKVNEVTA